MEASCCVKRGHQESIRAATRGVGSSLWPLLVIIVLSMLSVANGTAALHPKPFTLRNTATPSRVAVLEPHCPQSFRWPILSSCRSNRLASRHLLAPPQSRVSKLNNETLRHPGWSLRASSKVDKLTRLGFS